MMRSFSTILPRRGTGEVGRFVLVGAFIVVGVAVIFSTVRMGSIVSLAVGLIVCALPIFFLIAVRRPSFYCWIFGLVLGFAPFATVPGTGTQAVFLLAVLVVLVAILHARKREKTKRVSRIALWTILVIAACFMAFLASFSGEAANDYFRWVLATVLTVVGIWMAPFLRVALAKAFTIGAAAGAVLALLLEFADKSGSFVSSLTFIGYGAADSVDVRTVVVSGSTAIRATGLYVDPNSAGLFLLMGLAVTPFVFTGAWRAVLMALIAAGTVATLSRSAILSLAVATLVVLIAQRQTAARRSVITIVGIIGLGVLSFVPSISGRLSSSFSDSDIGASARWDAFARYPGQLAGHWILGKGWGLREFSDAFYGFTVNHVANTPLLVIYRSGLIAGVAFIGLLIVGIVISVRGLRSTNTGIGMMGAGFIGLVLVAFQLDFPVVTMPPLAMAFSVLLMNLGVAERMIEPQPFLHRVRQNRVHTVRELRLPELAKK